MHGICCRKSMSYQVRMYSLLSCLAIRLYGIQSMILTPRLLNKPFLNISHPSSSVSLFWVHTELPRLETSPLNIWIALSHLSRLWCVTQFWFSRSWRCLLCCSGRAKMSILTRSVSVLRVAVFPSNQKSVFSTILSTSFTRIEVALPCNWPTAIK